MHSSFALHAGEVPMQKCCSVYEEYRKPLLVSVISSAVTNIVCQWRQTTAGRPASPRRV